MKSTGRQPRATLTSAKGRCGNGWGWFRSLARAFLTHDRILDDTTAKIPWSQAELLHGAIGSLKICGKYVCAFEQAFAKPYPVNTVGIGGNKWPSSPPIVSSVDQVTLLRSFTSGCEGHGCK